MKISENKIRKKTIDDFNDQWKLQGELNKDYWSSDEILLINFRIFFQKTK